MERTEEMPPVYITWYKFLEALNFVRTLTSGNSAYFNLENSSRKIRAPIG